MNATAPVLGYPISLFPNVQTAIEGLFSEDAPERPTIVTLNPEMIMQGEANPEFASILKHATRCLPDGAGVVWALRRKGIVQTRLPGIECAEALLRHLHDSQNPRGVAFIGAKPTVMAQLPAIMLNRFADLAIAFTRDGYFPKEEATAIAKEMAETHPQVVMVALGVPAQEFWIAQHKHLFAKDTVFIGVGGSFDVWAGHVVRAPALMQKMHLEWAWRFMQEPWRIKRSTLPLLQFVLKVLGFL
jgi:N-acetylglucosaminyldiphosphoundecaprenol N-acetyl-beta-D-mannosaminyltransferase